MAISSSASFNMLFMFGIMPLANVFLILYNQKHVAGTYYLHWGENWQHCIKGFIEVKAEVVYMYDD